MLLQWHDAISMEHQKSYYVGNYDEDTDLQTLGEYPYSGKYTMLYNMCWRDMQNGQMHFEVMPLNSFLLETVVPIIIKPRIFPVKKPWQR